MQKRNKTKTKKNQKQKWMLNVLKNRPIFQSIKQLNKKKLGKEDHTNNFRTNYRSKHSEKGVEI